MPWPSSESSNVRRVVRIADMSQSFIERQIAEHSWESAKSWIPSNPWSPSPDSLWKLDLAQCYIKYNKADPGHQQKWRILARHSQAWQDPPRLANFATLSVARQHQAARKWSGLGLFRSLRLPCNAHPALSTLSGLYCLYQSFGAI